MPTKLHREFSLSWPDSMSENEAIRHAEQERDDWWQDKLRISKIEITETVDGYQLKATPAPPFQRIRRITGYLVGTTAQWNNAKRGELRDRVAHG